MADIVECRMVELPEVERIAGEAASAALDRGQLAVLVAPSVDPEGDDAIDITIVLPGDGSPLPTGDQAIDLSLAIRDTLYGRGEDRFAYISYATEDELAADGGP